MIMKLKMYATGNILGNICVYKLSEITFQVCGLGSREGWGETWCLLPATDNAITNIYISEIRILLKTYFQKLGYIYTY